MTVLQRRILQLATVGVALAAAVLLTAKINTTVAARPQEAKLTASPKAGHAPLAVKFSFPHTGDNSTWMMKIDFGDGASAGMGPPSSPPCSTGPTGVLRCPASARWSARHVYATAGTYTAKLTRGGLPLCGNCAAPVLGTVKVVVTARR